MTGGLRYSREDIKAIYVNGNFPPNSRRYNDTSPYLGVNWQATPDMLFYAKASKGFRAGGFHLDADFAKESANLTRAQILVQSGTSVLGIANQSSQSVLSLLR